MSEIDRETKKLYDAIQGYVESRGGKLLVIGVVQITRCPDREMNWSVCVKCTGTAPDAAVHDAGGAQEQDSTEE